MGPKPIIGGSNMQREYAPAMTMQLLGGLSARDFLARHWQRRPLLVRNAVPGFRGLDTRAGLFRLAAGEEVESRLLSRRGATWTLEHGPFAASRARSLPAKDWTLLVQGLNLHLPSADELLSRFAFVPWARLDDVMVSYAATGGGVGPHVDSYDVFLLQGHGRRRWRISNQRDLRTDPRAPHKLLARFEPTREWVLEPGDMLYLPPGVAHDGVALEPCSTYSIGFRAPTDQELGESMLDRMRDELCLAGRYRDPGLRLQGHPGRIPPSMLAHAARVAARVLSRPSSVEDLLGCALSEPKPGVRFHPPARPLPPARFAARAAAAGVRLDPRTRLLAGKRGWYLNGEPVQAPRAWRAPLMQLADQRAMAGLRAAPAALIAQLHQWYLLGYLHPGRS